ncbi:DODA-type extradiol aromatic ring-opening family dioxygenase [Paenibacillus sp. Leaf72]|uniref:DODA-type extradiol aromatic ring-opening family dioxygenase n=1 Tax=Paenibacillus sp. Leaf72 TaxID=1736234 RepID=UPI0006FA4E48|nr:class III extradiol ring-cleavage dioxygenase [Paenibacillus sp. Leaf72]KQO12427.1 MFS transporter [Paenibacillus sp. Leaf72]
MLPSLFICHGSPLSAMAESDYTRFLSDIGKKYKPQAIVLFSAHWEERNTTISFAEGTLNTIYDFYGFPDELYQLTYPAPGSPELAAKLEDRFRRNGITVDRDDERGLDHGSWIFLRYMYPEANIPIVTISVNPFLSANEQLQIGEALKGLGEENILVIGSGTTVHNFNEIKMNQAYPEAWAVEFDDWIADKIVQRDIAAFLQYETLAPHAKRAVPRAEHFVPILHALGSSSGVEQPKIIYRGYEMGTFSHICFEM